MHTITAKKKAASTTSALGLLAGLVALSLIPFASSERLSLLRLHGGNKSLINGKTAIFSPKLQEAAPTESLAAIAEEANRRLWDYPDMAWSMPSMSMPPYDGTIVPSPELLPDDDADSSASTSSVGTLLPPEQASQVTTSVSSSSIPPPPDSADVVTVSGGAVAVDEGEEANSNSNNRASPALAGDADGSDLAAEGGIGAGLKTAIVVLSVAAAFGIALLVVRRAAANRSSSASSVSSASMASRDSTSRFA